MGPGPHQHWDHQPWAPPALGPNRCAHQPWTPPALGTRGPRLHQAWALHSPALGLLSPALGPALTSRLGPALTSRLGPAARWPGALPRLRRQDPRHQRGALRPRAVHARRDGFALRHSVWRRIAFRLGPSLDGAPPCGTPPCGTLPCGTATLWGATLWDPTMGPHRRPPISLWQGEAYERMLLNAARGV